MGFPQKDPAGSRKIPTLVNHLPNLIPINSGFVLPTPVPAHVINYQVPTTSLNPKPLHLQQYPFPPIVQTLQPLVHNLHPSHHLPPPPNMAPHYTIPSPANLQQQSSNIQHPPAHLQHPKVHLQQPAAHLQHPPAHLQHPAAPIPASYTFHVGNINYRLPPAPASATSQSTPVSNTPMDVSQVPVDSQRKAKKWAAIVEAIFPKGKTANIQGFLDKCKDTSFIGLEYVLEIQSTSDKKTTPSYSCRLCEHLCRAKDGVSTIDNMRQHLATGTHKHKYLVKHFPTVLEERSVISPTDERISGIVGKVEAKYGRLKVRLIYGTKMYKKNLTEIDEIIEQSQHFSESQEFLDELNGKKPQAKLNSKVESSTARSRQRSTSGEADRRSNKDGTAKARISSKTPEESRKSWSRSPLRNRSPSPGGRKTQEKSWSRSPRRRSQSSGRRKRHSSKKSPIEVCIESSPEERRSRSRTPDSRRIKESSRSRSPTPKRYKIPEEPRREINRLKREERVREFIADERKMRIKLRGKREEHEKEFKDNNYNYSRHPKYSTEYLEFTDRKFGNQWKPKLSELDRDSKKQWTYHWLNILQEEHKDKKERKTEDLMRKHQIIQRDLDDYIEQRDNASQNRRSGEKGISSSGKERKGSPRNGKPRSLSPSPIKVTKNDVTVLGTLRLISAWENYLDEIGPKANVYLNKALFMESKKMESSEDLVNEADFCRMLDASLEKLKYRMGTGVIGESQEKTNCRICLNNIALLLQRSSCEKQEILEIGVSKINSAKESDHEIKKAITEQVFKQHSQQLGERELNLIVEKVYAKLKHHQNPAPNDLIQSFPYGNSSTLPAFQDQTLLSQQLYSTYSGQQEGRPLELHRPQAPPSSNLPQVDWANISKIVTQIKTGPPITNKPDHNSGQSVVQNSSLDVPRPNTLVTNQTENEEVIVESDSDVPGSAWHFPTTQSDKGVHDRDIVQVDKSDDDDEIQIIEPVKAEPNDPYDQLDMDDLVNLLQNFKELEKSQQECLLAYMKKLEKNHPDKARRLNVKFRKVV